MGRAEAAAKKLTVGKQYGFAFNATADYEGAWQFLPPMWSNGGDEKKLTSPEVAGALQLWKDLVDDGSASKSVVNWTQADVNDQFIAGKAAMMLNGPWQIPALDKAKINYGVVPIPVNTAGQTSSRRSAARRGPCRRPATRRKQAKAAETGQVPELRREPAAAGQGTADRCRPSAPWPISSRREEPSMAGFVERWNARARTGELGAEWPKAAKKIYTGDPGRADRPGHSGRSHGKAGAS